MDRRKAGVRELDERVEPACGEAEVQMNRENYKQWEPNPLRCGAIGTSPLQSGCAAMMNIGMPSQIKTTSRLRILAYTFHSLVVALVLTGCKPALHSTGSVWTSRAGIIYQCDIEQFKSRTAFTSVICTVVLISRTGGVGEYNSFETKVAGDSIWVDESPLSPPGTNILYYKKGKQRKSRELTNSGIWSVFFSGRQPTEAEMDRVFEELDLENKQ